MVDHYKQKIKLTWHYLLININNALSKEPKTITYFIFLSFAANLFNKYWKQLLHIATKAELDASKSASKKVVHKTDEGKGECIVKKIAEKTVKPKPVITCNLQPHAEEINILPEEKKKY